MALIKKEGNRLHRDLGIVVNTISRVKDMYVGLSATAAYAWGNGEVREFVPGDFVNFPSVSAATIERLSGMKFAGTLDNGQTAFMSASKAVHIALHPQRTALPVVDRRDVLQAAIDYATTSSDVTGKMLIASESATRTWATYQGRRMTIDDAHDEYELELTKGEKFSLTYLNRDSYELVTHDEPKIKFVVRGHVRAANLIGQSDWPKAFGCVGANREATFEPVGEVSRNMAQPLQIKKGTSVYMFRKRHYLAQNLVVPLEKIVSQGDLDKILASVKAQTSPRAIAKGREVGIKLPKLENAKKAKSVAPLKGSKSLSVVYGAFFAVSPATPNRSRIVFGSTAAQVQEQARRAISAMTSPVDYFMFQTSSNDELFDLARDGRIIIRASGLLRSAYPRAQQVGMQVAGAEGYEAPEYVEPATGAPELTVPAIAENEGKIVETLVRLISEGFFVTGLHLSEQQPGNAIRFAAPVMTDDLYDRVVAGSRRIAAYLVQQGVDMRGKVTSVRGNKVAEIRFKLPNPTAEQRASIERLVAEQPTLNSPAYETIKPKQPTVEITNINIHTGMVTVRAQRGPELFGSPYDVLYNNVVRKSMF
ncbi:hypothetical protein pEaSNUABM5_00122 [Erwinia phage pEa_SNUABM_5]|uniref:KTSC and Metallopeptidase-like N-terminal fusion domain-containing protein n=1 Tax=Erwinia phage pEa_SNUABM_5 TaxID=2797313 RepID=A0A7T8EPF9_9CAUD|nr:hypothetical protein MPK73_gp122 [Erwinia phage pEa_SNUABM_5]QQO90264.1 hypothetical protein pEaSNUABM5_00122 [Erwinia phage pEa_SNUABM_5]